MVKIKQQQQPNDYTCTHTCVAMIANIPVEQVIKDSEEIFKCKCTKDECGLHTYEEDALLVYYGYVPIHVSLPIYSNTLPQIITVPSLNQNGFLHRIVISSDGKIYDPCLDREGLKAYTNAKQIKSATEITWIMERKK